MSKAAKAILAMSLAMMEATESTTAFSRVPREPNPGTGKANPRKKRKRKQASAGHLLPRNELR